MRLHSFVAAAALFSVSFVTRADTMVAYTVSSAFGSGTDTPSASFNAPSIYTSPVTITDFTSETGGVTSVDLLPQIDPADCFGLQASCIFLNEADLGATEFLFFTTPLDQFGSYGDLLGIGEVNITPEPSSFALLGPGLLGIVGVMKRRFA